MILKNSCASISFFFFSPKLTEDLHILDLSVVCLKPLGFLLNESCDFSVIIGLLRKPLGIMTLKSEELVTTHPHPRDPA